MNELLLKIEYEIYWIKYLKWVYSEGPDEAKPLNPIERFING
jgi:hypothetical protein